MSLPTKFFKNFLNPRINRGSFYVKYLVCLQEFDDNNSGHSGQFSEFTQKHNLTPDQFVKLSDVLAGDLATIKRLSGSAYESYQQHLDYKIRNFGIGSGSNIEGTFFRANISETWNSLNQKYSGIKQALVPSARRLEILKDISSIFLTHGKVNGGSFSNVSDAQVDKIIANLNKYETRVLTGCEDDEERDTYTKVFKGIREDIQSNPSVFLVDTVSWIDYILTNGGEYSVLSTTHTPVNSSYKLTVTREDDNINPAFENNKREYIGVLNTQNQTAIRKFIPDSEGRILLVDNESSVETISFIPRYTFGALAAVWGATALLGTAPLSVLVGGPLIGAGLWKKIKQYESVNVPHVSHVYTRKIDSGNVLDIVVSQNGNVVETIEGVPSSDVAFINDPNTTINFGGKQQTLAQARKTGLSGIFDLVSVRGKNYFIASSYSSNPRLMAEICNQA